MRITLSDTVRGRRPIHQNVEQNASPEMQPTPTKNFKILIKRLTRREITKALRGEFSDIERTSADTCANNDRSKQLRKYNLRKRK